MTFARWRELFEKRRQRRDLFKDFCCLLPLSTLAQRVTGRFTDLLEQVYAPPRDRCFYSRNALLEIAVANSVLRSNALLMAVI